MRSSPACVCVFVCRDAVNSCGLVFFEQILRVYARFYILFSDFLFEYAYSPLNNRFTLVCAIECACARVCAMVKSVVVLPIEASRATVMHIQYKHT